MEFLEHLPTWEEWGYALVIIFAGFFIVWRWMRFSSGLNDRTHEETLKLKDLAENEARRRKNEEYYSEESPKK